MRKQSPLKKSSRLPREAPRPLPILPLQSALCRGEAKGETKEGLGLGGNLVSLPAEKGLPPAAAEPGAEGQPAPPWITMARQKRRGAPEQPPNQEDRPGARPLKSEVGKQAKAPERAQVLRANTVCLCRCRREQLAGLGAARPRCPSILHGHC